MASQPGRGARTENKLRNGLLATAGAAALMLGAPQAANATSYALSQLDVRNLIVSGIPAFGTFFSFSASVSATLEDTTGGFSASDGPEGPHSAGPVLAPFSLDRGISPGLVMDPALASVTLGGGGPIPAENSFTPIGYTGFPGLPSYSYADHILTDTLINGLPVRPSAATGKASPKRRSAATSRALASAATCRAGILPLDRCAHHLGHRLRHRCHDHRRSHERGVPWQDRHRRRLARVRLHRRPL